MTLGLSLAITGNLRDAMEAREAEVAQGMTRAAGLAARRVTDHWRGAITGAGLGERLARTVRGAVYPRAAKPSMSPAAVVFAKAPYIHLGQQGGTIKARNGAFLAIPTPDTPRKRQGKALTPDEVEERFGRALVFISARDKGFSTPSTLRGGAMGYLVMPDLVIRRKSGRWRNRTASENKRGKKGSAVIMFVLVRQVTLRKRYDFGAVERWAAGAWNDIAARSIADAFQNEGD
jgi:hypothetical protein